MYSVQANKSGSRIIAVSDRHMKTIAKYDLLQGLVGTSGSCDESVLDKLRYTVRSLILSKAEAESTPEQKADVKDLLDFCMDVLYNPSMKAYGLMGLIQAYNDFASSGQVAPHIG